MDIGMCWPHPEPVSGMGDMLVQFCVKEWAIVTASVGHSIGDDCEPFMTYLAVGQTIALHNSE